MPDDNPIPPEPETTETTQEQAGMLDVHPPHHAASTWRDFFIHIATIVIGLCIAVGIEQTVEFFHHHHLVRKAREFPKTPFFGSNPIVGRTDALNRLPITQPCDQMFFFSLFVPPLQSV
jgi:hypothetical protein